MHINFEDAYQCTQIAPADMNLSRDLYSHLHELLTIPHGSVIKQGANVTADSFYSSQGRLDDNFYDFNAGLLDNYVCARYPNAASMEMETFSLFHLAVCARKSPIFAAAASIVVANRCNAAVVGGDVLDLLEDQGGLAVLKAITGFSL